MARLCHNKLFYTLGIIILLLLLTLIAWLLLSGKTTQQDRTWQRVKAEGRLRIGIDPSYPPFETVSEVTSELEGYDVELAREIGRRLGFQVDFVYIGFDSLYDAVITDKIDAVISGMPYDPNWTEDIAYGIWYFNAGQFVVVRQDEAEIDSVEDLPLHRLGVELGTTGDLEARRLQRRIDRVKIETFSTADATLRALETQQIDAALVDAISAYLFISKGGKVRLLTQPISDESYAVVTSRKSTELRSAIDGVLLEMKEDGFLETLRNKWLLGRAS